MKGSLFIIGILFLVVSTLVTLNVFYQHRLQIDMAEQFSKQQLLLAQSAASDIESSLNNLKEEAVGVSVMLSDLMTGKQGRIKQKLDEYFQIKPGIKAKVAIFDIRGTVLYQRPGGEESASKWKEVKNEFALPPGNTFIYHDSYSIYLVAPIYASGRPVGALLFENPISIIADRYLAHIKSGTKGYAWMMDSSGYLLYHPTQPGMIGKNLHRTDPSCFKCHTSFALEKKIIEGTTQDFGRYLAPTGQDKIIAFSRATVGDKTWIVAVSAPYSEVIEAMNKSAKVYSVFIVTIFIAAGLATTALITYHRKKVKAEEIVRHEIELEKYALQLEQKVEERTSELVSEKEKLNTVISAIGGGILLIDQAGTIQWANPMMKEMAGQDITGKTCEDICQDCDISQSYKQDNIETTVISNLFGQKGKHFQITTAPVKGVDGKTHGYIRLIQDVTELKRMEEQIAHSDKLASIGRLAAGIAHEIGNPLTSIFSFVQILRDMEDDKFKKESLDIIYFHVNRISEILKQLSGFTRASAGEQKLARIDVNQVIENSVSLIQYDKKAKGIVIKRELSPDLPKVPSDANQLSQVFVNLTLNAIDAMPDGGTLHVRSFSAGKEVLIQFQDTGMGIPKEELNRVFDPFYTTKEKGTGLGLSVSYNIIKKMGGTINVESEVGKGTLFTVAIPASNEHV